MLIGGAVPFAERLENKRKSFHELLSAQCLYLGVRGLRGYSGH